MKAIDSSKDSDGQSQFFAASSTVSFADVAHQTLIFSKSVPHEELLLKLIDCRWMQRLRNISQTGNTKLVYMFAEHSRFGHSLGVAFLALLLMKQLRQEHAAEVAPFEAAVAVAALLHDLGHVAPGSHLAEKLWAPNGHKQHEVLSARILKEDPEIGSLLDEYSPDLRETVIKILAEDEGVPSWTKAIISGGGWNADRGNWAIVDSTMCSVSYGRYNVTALIDAFCLSRDGQLVLKENRLDALTHFFVARDSMYRQVYQHRVLQTVDALSKTIVVRARELVSAHSDYQSWMFCDDTMSRVLSSEHYGEDLPLSSIFEMNESWWHYHIHRWCGSQDKVLSDLCKRHRDRRLFKTIRLPTDPDGSLSESAVQIIEEANRAAVSLELDPRFYVHIIEEKDKHRVKSEAPPLIALESGGIAPVNEVEPLIAQIMRPPGTTRTWLAVPKKVKEILGRRR